MFEKLGEAGKAAIGPNVPQPYNSDGAAVTTNGENQEAPTTASMAASAVGVPQQAAIVQQLLGIDDGEPSNILAGDDRLSVQLPGGLRPEQVTAIPMAGTKDWHQSVKPDHRNHLVHKM